MSDSSQGDGWWVASDGKWYAPEQHPDYVAPAPPNYAAETIAVPVGGTPAPVVDPANPGPAFTPAGPTTQTYNAEVPNDPDYNLPATAATAPSKRRNLILGIGAAVLVVGLGFLAFQFFTGAGSAGGASSPEAAIDQLISSVNDRDAVGFVDVFDPDEIDAWFGSFAPAFSAFEGLADTGEADAEITDVYESIFESFDYELTGIDGQPVTYQVEPLDDAGRISRVRIEGLDFELTVAETDRAIIVGTGDTPTGFDLSQVSGTRVELRDQGSGLANRSVVPGEPATNDFAEGAHIDLVTVQKDGKWFVSIGYSMLELARTQGQFDEFGSPDFGRAFELVESQTGGAESPEAVVRELFASAETLDYENMFRLTDPYGTPYLHDYQPLIDSQVDQQERRELIREIALNFNDLDLTVSEWEGRTLVTTTDISAVVAGGEFSIDTTSWCITLEDDSGVEENCLEDALVDPLAELDNQQNPRDFIPGMTGLIVTERNGRWYLDPLGTLGYYSDQIADEAVALTNDMDGNPASELSGFFFSEGPIARLGVPATHQAESGSAAVALDLSGYPTIDSYHVAVARVVTNAPGEFVSYDNRPLTGEEWFVVYDDSETSPEIPAIAASTDGELDVELFEVQVTEVGPDGYTGQLGGQGRPQVFTLGNVDESADITIDGAEAVSVFAWESDGVVLPDPFGSFISNNALFLVVNGEPGATFNIRAEVFEPEPEPEEEPEPTPEPEPGPDASGDVSDPFALGFALLVEPAGFEYSNEQQGGFFDGCGGPDDPDVISYVFERAGGALAIVTPYPNDARAENAFDLLANVESPCAAFTEIQVNDVVIVDGSNIRIEWQFPDDADSIVYEHYRLAGNTIIVVSNESLAGIEEQLVIVSDW